MKRGRGREIRKLFSGGGCLETRDPVHTGHEVVGPGDAIQLDRWLTMKQTVADAQGGFSST